MDNLDLGETIKGFLPGQKVFARYTLTRILGRGGMGVVWLARDEELEREVALKFLPEVVAADKEAVKELKRETRRSLELTHSHIVRIYDFVQDARTAAISMEYIAGDTLSSRKSDLDRGHFEPAELSAWVAQLCSALDYAHDVAQIVHRDLKPANLMVDARGHLKVADFGIATSISDSVSRVSKQAGSSGTPVYMSPQQMMGERPAVTDDIYALGATLYDLLSGKPPFYSGNIIVQVQGKVAPSITERRRELNLEGGPIPPEWEQTIAACLAKEPKDRPQSAGEMAERLGLAAKGNTQRPTSNAERSNENTKVERGVPTRSEQVGASLADARAATSAAPTKSKTPLYAGLAAAVLALGALGWYFGIHAPEQKRLAEQARIEAERVAAEQQRIKLEQEKAAAAEKETKDRAAAEARERQERERLVAERLANARGGIVIRTNPPGAEVRVGAVALDRSPLTLKEQKLGKYPVRIRMDGYEEWSGEVEVKENEFADLDVALVRSTGTAAFSSDPPGLEIEVVGRAVPGTPAPAPRQTVRTPVDLKLPTGAYDVILRRSGWPDQKRTIEVTRHQTIPVNAEFMGGTLELHSTPSGAEVWSGGKQVGTTPYRVPEALPGSYNYELRLKGYQNAAASLNVQPRQQARGSVALEKEPHFVLEGLGLEMRHISPGTFSMGSASGGNSYENPVTRVTLTRPFWLGKTEVTQAQWTAVMGSNPSYFKGGNLPVEQVSWSDAMEFCRKLTERERAAGRLPEGHVYTLPTEAQWEYACRAGTTGDYAGNLDAIGWYDKNSGSTTHSVGQKQANAWGLHDMHGNVWELCADWSGNYPGGSVSDPTGPLSGSRRVYRGGSWFSPADYCRSANRSGVGPGDRAYLLGFRPALVPISLSTESVQKSSDLPKKQLPEVGQKWTIPGLSLDLMPIAPGTFQMGSGSGGKSDERPVTRVTLTKPFWLGKTEVTQAQWQAVMGSNPSHFKGDNLPVEQVSWNEAMEFCRKLTERERSAGRLPDGYAYALPTEAQWEYACRAGTTGDYAGSLDAMGWYKDNSGGSTKPVGTKRANAWGLHDMHGNVWEWCADWYGNYPGGSVTDPTGPPSGSDRVIRGGGWGGTASGCRSANRDGNGPGAHVLDLGFRLALAPRSR